jgi:hypothetical protein
MVNAPTRSVGSRMVPESLEKVEKNLVGGMRKR